jgi:hypothetical protein
MSEDRMTSLSARRVTSKTNREARSVRIVSGLNGENAGTISITCGKLVTFYEAWRNDTAFGDCWQLTKLLADGQYGESYNVLLAGQESNCDCAGHTFNDHCKHCDGLNALQARGLLN